MKLTGPALITIDSNKPSGAFFDSRRRYRYLLWRSWESSLPAVSFIMLNPSAADETFNDPTIARSISMARELGFGRLYVVNLFAYMTKSPALLKAAAHPVSPRGSLKQGLHNDDYIRFALTSSRQCVMAWGNHGLHQGRNSDVLKIIEDKISPENCYVFAMTKQGQPRHPLYTPKSISLQSAPLDLWS